MSGRSVTPPPNFVPTLQILVSAMTLGLVFFLVIAVIAVPAPKESPSDFLTTRVMLTLAALLASMRLAVEQIIVTRAHRKLRSPTVRLLRESQGVEPFDDIAVLSQLYMTRTIAAAAILEGAAFLTIIAYLVARSPVSLAFATVLIALIAAHIPTTARAGSWIANQQRLLDEERAFQRS